MASRIKGITVEIGGDTTGLDKALKNVKQQHENDEHNRHDRRQPRQNLVARFALVLAEIGIGRTTRYRAGQPLALAGLQHDRNDKKDGHQQQQTADYIIKNIHFPDSSESPFYAVKRI